MAKYRVLKDIHYVDDGKVKMVRGGLGKEIDLTDDQAQELRGKVVLLKTNQDMFPDGGPLLEPEVATNRPIPEAHEVKEDRKPKAKRHEVSVTVGDSKPKSQ